MSPQPAAPAAAPAPDALKVPDGTNPMAERQIKRAMQLEFDRGELLKKINANREMLRLMAETDELSEPQEDWLDVFYPQKEKDTTRSVSEVEATRKAREAARKTKIA